MRRTLIISSLLFASLGRAQADGGSAIVKTFWKDGASLATSPLRIGQADPCWAIGVTVAMGGSLAFDRVTRRNFLSKQDSGAAADLRRFGDVAQFAGPALGGVFFLDGWARQNLYEKRVSAELV